MDPKNTNSSTVEEYIKQFPEDVQLLLQEVRKTILDAAPQATEYIGYKMPAYKLNGVLAYFAAYKNHIGFYSTPSGHREFDQELSKYKTGKGSVQFPLDEPWPLDLISRMIKFKLKENTTK